MFPVVPEWAYFLACMGFCSKLGTSSDLSWVLRRDLAVCADVALLDILADGRRCGMYLKCRYTLSCVLTCVAVSAHVS